MSWTYRKPEAVTVRGTCIKCLKNPQKHKGKGKYKAICSQCDKKTFSPESTLRRKKPYLLVIEKKPACECCGFVATHPCQLDVDHIDGDHENNAPENLQTLCANCHRLKTFLNRDWETK